MKLSIIIPTLNEKENLKVLIPQLDKIVKPIQKDFEILIIDDNSQDGTATLLEGYKKKYKVRLIVRKNEKGLSGAVIEGFKQAKGDSFVVMDADLSHPPELLAKIVPALKAGNDIVLPSRYVRGGGVERWPWNRRILSIGATSLAKLLTRMSDPMSGYFAIRKEVVQNTRLNPIGYKILLEVLVKGHYDYKKSVQIPYIFQNRFRGHSKLNTKISMEYIKQLFMLYTYKFAHLFTKRTK